MNNRINLMAILVIAAFFTLTAQGTSPEHQAYINQYEGIAIREMVRTGIPASIKLAQALLESGAGKSPLSEKANNHFGIKCGGEWCGEVYYKEDDDKNASGTIIPSCFRSYDSAEQSFVDHSDFLKNPKKSRYDFLFRLDPTDYKAWARGLKKAGYATSETYPAKLISLIERYRLYEYDQVSTTLPVVEVETPLETTTAETTRPAQQPMVIIGANQEIEMPVKNNRSNRDTYHTVQYGETMADIAQDYSIALFWLNYKNKMKEGMQPAIGSRIKLTGPRVAYRPELVEKRLDLTSNDNEAFIIWPNGLASSENGSNQSNTSSSTDDLFANSQEIDFDKEPFSTSFIDSSQTIHKVQKGETLWSISKKYNMDIDDLKRRNKLITNTISVNQVIVLQ